MASMMYRSVARTKLLSNAWRRNDKKISSLLHREPLISRFSRVSGRSFLLHGTTGINAYSSTSSYRMREGVNEIDFLSKPYDNPNIMCTTQYHQLMDFHIERGDVASVEKIMTDMNRDGPPPTITTINKLLSVYTHLKYPKGMQGVLDRMILAGIEPNNASICLKMKAHARAGDIEGVEQLMKESLTQGYVPDAELFNEVVRAYATAENLEGAEMVVRDMPQMSVMPNEETLHIIMTANALLGDIIATDGTLREYESMGFTPTTKTINILLISLINDPNGVDMKVFLSCYNEYFGEGKLTPNVDTYTHLLRAAEEANSYDDVIRFYEELLLSGMKVTVGHRSSLKNILEPEVYNKILRINQNKILKDRKEEFEYEKIEKSYSLMNFAYRGDVEKVVLQLAENKKNKVHGYDARNFMIYSHCRAGDFVSARKLINEIDWLKNKSDNGAYLVLMRGYADHGDAKQVEILYSEAITKGIVLDIEYLNEIVRAYAVAADPVGAEMVLSALPELGLQPNERTLKQVMMAYANIGDLDSLENIYQKYEDLGFTHNTSTKNIVLKSMVNAPILIWDYFKTMTESLFGTGIKIPDSGSSIPDSGLSIPDVNTYIQLLLACEKYGKVEDSIVWYEEMKGLGLKITPLVRNIYRQTIEDGIVEKEKLFEMKSLWISESTVDQKDNIPVPVNYDNIWGSALRSSIEREKIVDICKVSGIDEDPKAEVAAKRVYGGGPASYRKLIVDRKRQNAPLSITLFNNLIDALMKEEKYDEAKEVYFNEIKGMNIPQDIKTARLLLPAYTSNGDYLGAEALLEDTVAQGIELKYYHLAEVIKAYGLRADPAGAEKVFDLVVAMKQTPNKEIFHSLMSAYTSIGDEIGCMNTYKKYLEERLEESVICMNIILSSQVYSTRGFNWIIFNNLYKNNFGPTLKLQPDRFTYTQMILGAGRAKKTDEAKVFFEQFLESELILTVDLLSVFRETIGEGKYTEWKGVRTSRELKKIDSAVEYNVKGNSKKEKREDLQVKKKSWEPRSSIPIATPTRPFTPSNVNDSHSVLDDLQDSNNNNNTSNSYQSNTQNKGNRDQNNGQNRSGARPGGRDYLHIPFVPVGDRKVFQLKSRPAPIKWVIKDEKK